MRIRGALHVHSKLSHDGTMTIVELASWYKRHGYQFIAIGEHAQDLDEGKRQELCEMSAESSSRDFCVIPGMEFAVTRTTHIVGLGVSLPVCDKNPLKVVQMIQQHGGFAVLAHPKRMAWECPAELCRALNAVEIWNVGYDGKYLPSPRGLIAFRRMSNINPKLLAVASHDFHQPRSFYDVAIETDVTSISAEAILGSLRQGSYSIRSRFFRSDSLARLSRGVSFSLDVLSPLLGALRDARSFLLG
jgi:hypothetical protein